MKRKKAKSRMFRLDMTKPETGAGAEYAKQVAQKVVKIEPFKASRDLRRYPVRRGQGVTINGWQFHVRTVQPNGMLYLKPIGRIIEEVTPPATVLAPEEGPVEVDSDSQNINKEL